MINVTSTVGKYILQPSLMDMHHQSLDGISATLLWKRELSFFRKIITDYAPRFTSVDDKKQIDHFENLITYYNGEVVDGLRKKLRDHENRLAHALQEVNESDTEYFTEHKSLINEVEAFGKSFSDLKHELFEFIERGMFIRIYSHR